MSDEPFEYWDAAKFTILHGLCNWWEKVDICECGHHPIQEEGQVVLWYVREVLKQLIKAAASDVSGWVVAQDNVGNILDLDTSNVGWLYLYMLDQWGLCTHGTSIRYLIIEHRGEQIFYGLEHYGIDPEKWREMLDDLEEN